MQDMTGDISIIFAGQGEDLLSVKRSAREALLLIEMVSPLMEAYSAAVCPGCCSVCCINRHSRYDRSDVIFMAALGRELPPDSPGVPETAPCRFLGRKGCVMDRSQRPYRCTWFFCQSLLEHIREQTSISEYRRFINILTAITERRTSMTADFERISADSPDIGECDLGE